MKRWFSLLIGLLIAFSLVACSPPAQNTPTPVTLTATSLPAFTATPLPSATPEPMHTAAPVDTATVPPFPTATPTLALPVTLGTPLPELAPITAENFARLELVGDYRRLTESGLRIVLSGDGKTFLTVTAHGMDVFASDEPGLLRHLDIPVQRAFQQLPLWHIVQLSADGSRLLIIRARGADVFSITGEKLFQHDSPEGLEWENLAYAFSPDGKFVAVEMCSVGCYRKNAPFTQDFLIFDVDSGESVYHWNQGVGGELRGANPVFSPNGKYLVTYIGGQAFLWDTATWKKITAYTAEVDWLTYPRFAYFSPDSNRLAIISESTITIWETSERRVVGQWQDGRISPTTQIIFSSDGAKIGTLDAGVMQVRDTTSGKVLEELPFTSATIGSVRLRDDGTFQAFTREQDDNLIVPPWDADLDTWGITFDPLAQTPTLRIPGKSIDQTCTWQPDGTADCEAMHSIPGTDGKLYRLEFEEISAAIYSADGSERPAGVPARQFDAVQEVFGFDPVGKFLFYNARVKAMTPYGTLADLSHGNLEVIAQWPMPFVASAISPDGKYIALQARAFSKSQLLIFDLEQRQMIYDRNFLYGTPGLAFSADSSTLMHLLDQPGIEDIQRLTLMRMDDRNRPKNIPLDASYSELPRIFQFAPDGDLLYSLRTGDLRWMHLPDGVVVASIDPFPDVNLAHAFALSPDGRLLAVFYQGELKVWGVQP